MALIVDGSGRGYVDHEGVEVSAVDVFTQTYRRKELYISIRSAHGTPDWISWLSQCCLGAAGKHLCKGGFGFVSARGVF